MFHILASLFSISSYFAEPVFSFSKRTLHCVCTFVSFLCCCLSFCAFFTSSGIAVYCQNFPFARLLFCWFLFVCLFFLFVYPASFLANTFPYLYIQSSFIFSCCFISLLPKNALLLYISAFLFSNASLWSSQLFQ